MRSLQYGKIASLAYDITDVAEDLERGYFGSRQATDADIRALFVKLALELDYVVKHVPRPDARCAYTIDMGF